MPSNAPAARRRYPIDFAITPRFTWPFCPARFGYALRFEDGWFGKTVGRFKTIAEAAHAARSALIAAQAAITQAEGDGQ